MQKVTEQNYWLFFDHHETSLSFLPGWNDSTFSSPPSLWSHLNFIFQFLPQPWQKIHQTNLKPHTQLATFKKWNKNKFFFYPLHNPNAYFDKWTLKLQQFMLQVLAIFTLWLVWEQSCTSQRYVQNIIKFWVAGNIKQKGGKLYFRDLKIEVCVGQPSLQFLPLGQIQNL